MDYYFKTYSLQLKNDWLKVFSNSDEVWLFTDIDVLTFFSSLNGAENISFIMYNKDNVPVAICPLFKSNVNHKFGIKSVKIESLSASGPAIIKTFSVKKRREVHAAMTQEFKRLIAIYNCNYFVTAAPNMAKQNIDAKVNPLLDVLGFSDSPKPYYYLDLTKSENDLIAAMETRTRSIINKLDKENNFTIAYATEKDLDALLQMAKSTKERFGETFDMNNKSLFTYILKSDYFKKYIAYIDKRPACAIILASFKDTAYYYLSFTETVYVNTEIGTYLLWYAIRDFKRNFSGKHFDIGVNLFDPKNPKDVYISKFKRGFGGELRYKFWIKYSNTPKLLSLFRLLTNKE